MLTVFNLGNTVINNIDVNDLSYYSMISCFLNHESLAYTNSCLAMQVSAC